MFGGSCAYMALIGVNNDHEKGTAHIRITKEIGGSWLSLDKFNLAFYGISSALLLLVTQEML